MFVPTALQNTQIPCDGNAEFLNVKPSDKYSYRYALKV